MTVPNVIAETLPEERQGLRMTYEEYLAWADEDVHAEWVDGEVIIQMPPKPRHQFVTGFLYELLHLFVRFFRLGEVLTAPVEMKLYAGGPAREPDIIFVANQNLKRITEEHLVGPADLVVEVVSEDSVNRDRVKKFNEYQAAGVREYWIIDARPNKEKAEFFVVDAQGKFQSISLDPNGIYRSIVLPGFWLRVNWLWEEELPDQQLTFGEIANFPDDVMKKLRAIAARGPQT